MENFPRLRRRRTPASQARPQLFSASPSPSGGAARTSKFCVVDRLVTIERARDRRQRVFKACRAIEQHHAIIFRDAAIVETLLVGGVGGCSLRTQQQAFLTRNFAQRGRNLLISHRNGETLALAQLPPDQEL